MDQKQQDFYQKLRKQIRLWAEKRTDKNHQWVGFILLAPDLFHLLCKLMIESEIPLSKKAKLAAAIAYFISPIDLLPEVIFGPVGYLDDVALAAYVLNDLINEVDPRVITENWAGEQNILNLIKTILINSDKILGSGLWKRIRKKISSI